MEVSSERHVPVTLTPGGAVLSVALDMRFGGSRANHDAAVKRNMDVSAPELSRLKLRSGDRITLSPMVTVRLHMLQQSIPSFCIHGFRMILSVNSDYFPEQR
jgi:hypothetical protein